jgi:putative addiction module antidote
MQIHKNSSLGYNRDRVEISSLYSYLRRELFMSSEGKIRKIGNSLGVIIPATMLKKLDVQDGDTVYISLEDDGIKIRNTEQKQIDDDFKQKVITILNEYMKEHKIK